MVPAVPSDQTMRDAAWMRRVPGFILFLFVADGGLVLAYAADWALGGQSARVTTLLDPKGTSNLVAWYASMQLFLLACLLASFARDKLDWRTKRSWLLPLLPVVVVALSFEQIADLHKWYILRSGGLLSRGIVHELLTVLALAALAATAGSCLRPYVRGHRHIGATYVLSMILLGVAGIGVRWAVVWLPPQPGVRLLAVCGEALGELVSVTLMLWATHELLRAHRVSPLGASIPHLRGDPPT